MADDTATDTAPPELSPAVQSLADAGFAIADGWPVNHRLRAEALAQAGEGEDPAGYLTAEQIAETAERLEAEAAEAREREEQAAPSEKWRRDDLVNAAAARGLDTTGTKAELVKSITAADAANSEG